MSQKSEPISYLSPIYLQLREIVRTKIQEGAYPAGTAIPSENELAETYGITRLTVRNALNALVSEGLIKRVQGKGAFVAGAKVEHSLNSIGGFLHAFQDSAGSLTTKILCKGMREAGEKYSCIFGLSPADPLFYIKRVCYSGGEAVLIEESYIPGWLGENLDEMDLSVFTMEQVLKFHGTFIHREHQALRIKRVRQKDAKILGIGTDQPVLSMEATSYDSDSRVIAYSRSYVRNDKCDFCVAFQSGADS